MKFENKYVLIPLVSTVCMVVTFLLNHELKLGAVVAASIVGLASGLISRNALYAIVGYSAAFVGMSSKAVIPAWYYLVPVALIHAVVIIALTKKFVGWGGKGGLMAFLAVALSSGFLLLLSPIKYYQPDALQIVAGYSVEVWAVGIAAGVVGIMATILVREKCCGGPKTNDAVVGSATVALVAGVIAPALVAEPYGIASFAFVAPIITSATYAGMAARKILPKMTDFLIVGVVVGLLNIALWPIFPGFGGRLGTIGLISCGVWLAVIKIRQPKTPIAPAQPITPPLAKT